MSGLESNRNECYITSARVTPGLTGSAGVGRGRVHAGVAQDLHELAAEGAHILLDLVDVVLGDAAALGAPLLHRYIAAD